jgi:hypothetical protein
MAQHTTPARRNAPPSPPSPAKDNKPAPRSSNKKEKGSKGNKRISTSEAGVAALNIQRIPIAELKPHPRNPRKHPNPGSKEWETLKASLNYDYFDPIVVNQRNGLLVSGHLRSKLFAEMGVTEADVVVVDYDEHIHMARMLAANKPFGSNDKASMKAIFAELVGVGEFDLDLTGFLEFEIGQFGVDLSGTGPEFVFTGGENSDTPPADGENPYDGEQTGDQRGDVRYFQLIFDSVGYDRFKELTDQVKSMDDTVLRQAFGERGNEMPNVLMHVLESYLTLRQTKEAPVPSGKKTPARRIPSNK